MRLCAVIGFLALTTLMSTHQSWAMAAEQAKSSKPTLVDFDTTLAGVKSFSVNVQMAYLSDGSKDGLSTATLQTDTELQLRSFGIPVATASPGRPAFNVTVSVNTVKSTSGDNVGYIANARASFWHEVRLERDTTIGTIALTWEGVAALIWIVNRVYTSHGQESHGCVCR